jgi:nucleoside-diphosphate-sugar epimerase
LLQSPWADRSVILRLAGIYGPERLPRLKQLQAGQPLETAPADLLNLIHVDDAAEVIQRVADGPLVLPCVFLVADGQPVERGAFYAEAARLWQTPPPVFGTVPDGAQSHRGGGNKRVCNTRMQTELGVTLRYPSYREGLAAIRRDLRIAKT